MNGPPPQVPPNRKTHRFKVVVLIFVGLIALYFVYRYTLSRSIQTRIDAIHRAGFPATCAELDKWYVQPPPGENAATVYGEAFAHFQMWTNESDRLPPPSDAKDRPARFTPHLKRDLLPIVGMAKLPPGTKPLPPEMQKLITEYLAANSESLQLLHRAGLMKSSRYPVDFKNGVMTLFPHLKRIRQAARLLELEVIQYTDRQQAEPAIESVSAIFGVSQSLSQEPSVISYDASVACDDLAVGGLERCINEMVLTDVQLANLAVVISEVERRKAFTCAFVGERCTHVDFLEGLRTGRIPATNMNDDDPVPVRVFMTVYSLTGLLQLDERTYLDEMERYIEATKLPSPENIIAFRTLDEQMQHLAPWHFLLRMMVPVLDYTLNKSAACDAKMRDARSALAIERYRLANGKLPGQLTDLVPAFLPSVPTDPFDGKPLRYKTLAKGYVVYSVGEDREDNGGTEKNSKGISYVPGTDITFTVER